MSDSQEFSRRKFLKDTTLIGVGAMSLPMLSAVGNVYAYNTPGPGLDLAVAKLGSPAENTIAAIKALGGIGRFVKSGDKVVLKPNIISSNAPEFAVNTHPDVVGAVTKLCVDAGAREVISVTNDRAGGFIGSGAGDAITKAGGTWAAINDRQDFRDVILPRGILLRNTEIIHHVLDADVFINIPVAKDHGGSSLTLGMKNYMGINYNRLIMHNMGLHQCIADLSTAVKPHLIIIDANYMLLTNGPGGPGATRNQKTVIASTDPVLADAYASTLFNFQPSDVDHVRFASEMGLGSMNLKKAKIQEFSLQ